MADQSSAPKPSSSVKLVLLGEAAVGKVGCAWPLPQFNSSPATPSQLDAGMPLGLAGFTVEIAIPYPHVNRGVTVAVEKRI